MTARHPRRHDFRPQTPLRRSALLRPVSSCVERAQAARVYPFPPPIGGNHDRVNLLWLRGRTGTGAEAAPSWQAECSREHTARCKAEPATQSLGSEEASYRHRSRGGDRRSSIGSERSR